MKTVYRSTVFDAPIEAVWPLIRDFNGWTWLPLGSGSAIEGGGPADRVGCIRQMGIGDGPPAAREMLMGLSDEDHSLTYGIVESIVPLKGYVATVRLRPITDGNRTFAEWSGRLDDSEQADALVAMVGEQVYEGGFAGLRQRLAK
jgi:hypothetical protein